MEEKPKKERGVNLEGMSFWELMKKSTGYRKMGNEMEIKRLENKLKDRRGERDKEVLQRLGILYSQVKNKEKSKDYFKEAYGDKIKEYEELVKEGEEEKIGILLDMYIQTGEKEKAKGIYSSEIKRLEQIPEKEKNSQHYRQLAELNDKLRNKEKVNKYSKLAKQKSILEKEEKIEELENRSQKDESDLKELIRLNFEMGRREKVEEYLNLIDDSKESGNFEYLGFVYNMIGEKKESEKYYKKAYKNEIKKLETNFESKTNQERRKLLSLYEKTGKREKAREKYISEIKRIEVRIEREPEKYNNEKELRYLATLYLDLGSLKEGL
jgi:tetratricopeptide (TPR) repeat protein